MQPSNSSNMSIPECQNGFDQSSQDDFFEQILSSIPSSWTEFPSADLDHSNAWSFNPNSQESVIDSVSRNNQNGSGPSDSNMFLDESVFLASKLRQHQIGASSVLLDRQLLLSNCVNSTSSSESGSFLPFPDMANGGDGDSHLLVDRALNDATISPNFNSFAAGGGSSNRCMQALYNGFVASLQPPITNQPQHLHHSHAGITVTQNIGSEAMNAPPPKQRVRARRGQATDPHSIAERLRRERIAERMRALQELVPNANKTDKASMLDEIIDYVKFLQLQVKVLSMSRLGAGVRATSPTPESDFTPEEGGGLGRAPSTDALAVTEHQVAKLMEEDMGSAMQYLQGKGLCLMPLSLATAISVATCRNRNHSTSSDGPATYATCPSSVTASLAACCNRSAIMSADGPASSNISVMSHDDSVDCSEVRIALPSPCPSGDPKWPKRV